MKKKNLKKIVNIKIVLKIKICSKSDKNCNYKSPKKYRKFEICDIYKFILH